MHYIHNMHNMHNMTCFSWPVVLLQHRNIGTLMLLHPMSVFVQILNRSKSLQKQMFPILSWKALSEIPDWLSHLTGIHNVFPLVVGIRGLIHLPQIHPLLQYLYDPQKHWSTTIASAVLASVLPTLCSLAACPAYAGAAEGWPAHLLGGQ
jgi:hypothetical protein